MKSDRRLVRKGSLEKLLSTEGDNRQVLCPIFKKRRTLIAKLKNSAI